MTLPAPQVGAVTRAAHLKLRAASASFRNADMMVALQPTYQVMPPSTVFGLLQAMRQDMPGDLSVSIQLTHQGVFEDYEHTWMIKQGGSKLSPTKRGCLAFPVLELTVFDPHGRISPEEIVQAARFPEYPLSLGRHQDIATLVKAEVTELTEVTEGTLEQGTLAPWSLGRLMPSGRTLALPTYINPQMRTMATFDRYRLADVAMKTPEPGQRRKPSALQLRGSVPAIIRESGEIALKPQIRIGNPEAQMWSGT